MTAGKERALIAMSGGVDSSVAALLSKRMGYDCAGITMKLSPGAPGIDSAALAAEFLGMRHIVLDLSDEFGARVIEPFIASYEAGETPNPCVTCNKEIKFGRLFEYAMAEGFDRLVTGHYAVIEQGPDGEYRLKRASDRAKDQSYFLYGLTHEKLSHILFPLGGLTKKEVRSMAEEAGLPAFDKSESQDICFIPDGDHAGFIAGYRGTPLKGGDFVDTEGRVLGRHGGVERYTIGQRRGLGVALGRPAFVKEIRSDTNEVVLAGEAELFVPHIDIADMNWHIPVEGGPDIEGEGAPEKGMGPLRAQVMIRYNAAPVWATIIRVSDGRFRAEFDVPVRAPACGQSAVMYDGDYVIGGGRIAPEGK